MNKLLEKYNNKTKNVSGFFCKKDDCEGFVMTEKSHCSVKGDRRTAEEAFMCNNCGRLYRIDGTLITSHEDEPSVAIGVKNKSFFWEKT